MDSNNNRADGPREAELRAAIHRLVDDWLDRVFVKQPDGEYDEKASLGVSLWRPGDCDENENELWSWTSKERRTVHQG